MFQGENLGQNMKKVGENGWSKDEDVFVYVKI